MSTSATRTLPGIWLYGAVAISALPRETCSTLTFRASPRSPAGAPARLRSAAERRKLDRR